MTIYLIDLADPYQAGIDLKKVKAAGFSAVNIKTSQGTGYSNPRLGQWVREARAEQLELSMFHWLDNSASGAAQAATALGAARNAAGKDLSGIAWQCDCESNATWTILRDFITAMQDGLGRHIALYTGDWWATSRGPSWRPSTLTPYLWAATNDGYPGSYPGDGSTAWHAGYWGFSNLALMQYAVSPPYSGAMKCSKTAVRDAAVWAALTGGNDVPLTTTDAKTVWNADIAPYPSSYKPTTAADKANTEWTPVNLLRSTWDHAHLADAKADTILAQLAALSSAVQTLATNQGMDPAQVLAAVQAGAEKAVQDALAQGADSAAAGQ